MAWALLQMHEGEEVGLSSALREFQEKMRLGGIYRLGFALLSPWIFADRAGFPPG